MQALYVYATSGIQLVIRWAEHAISESDAAFRAWHTWNGTPWEGIVIDGHSGGKPTGYIEGPE